MVLQSIVDEIKVARREEVDATKKYITLIRWQASRYSRRERADADVAAALEAARVASTRSRRSYRKLSKRRQSVFREHREACSMYVARSLPLTELLLTVADVAAIEAAWREVG